MAPGPRTGGGALAAAGEGGPGEVVEVATGPLCADLAKGPAGPSGRAAPVAAAGVGPGGGRGGPAKGSGSDLVAAIRAAACPKGPLAKATTRGATTRLIAKAPPPKAMAPGAGQVGLATARKAQRDGHPRPFVSRLARVAARVAWQGSPRGAIPVAAALLTALDIRVRGPGTARHLALGAPPVTATVVALRVALPGVANPPPLAVPFTPALAVA